MPDIFLAQVLDAFGEKNLAVPRIFLLPKEDISFEFSLPYKNMSCDSGNNCIQVKSNSFDIYKEYIEGNGEVGDRSFLPFGHADFNAKQIITSKENHKKYLIDTKEQKEFFLTPIFTIWAGVF